MIKIIHRTVSLVALLCSVVLLYGCSATNHQAYFDEHEINFRKQSPFTTHYVQRNGQNIHVREFGEQSSEPTLILMHGFPDSLNLYDWLVPKLTNQRHIVTFDFLGWGRSDKPLDHTYDFTSLQDDLNAVVASLDLDNFILVLHDASGPPGINWALSNTEKIAGLILLNTFYTPMPTLTPPEEIKIFSTPGVKRELSVFFTRYNDRLMIDRYNAQMDKFISTPELREPFKKIMGHHIFDARNAFYNLNEVLLDELNNNRENLPSLKSFNKPVRIIFGKDDPYLNNGVAEEFHKLFPDSELFLVQGGGHFVQVDKPDTVARLITELPL